MIEKYNLITDKNIVKPNYHPRPENRSMKCIFLSDREILLLGMADNNYLFWISKTELSALEMNRDMIEFILYGEYENLASGGEEFRVLDRVAGKRKALYSVNFYQSFNSRGIKIWSSDAGISIEYGDGKGNGRLLAKILMELPQKLMKLSTDREAGGSYKMVLRDYLKRMETSLPNPLEDYNRIKGILDILKSERYLLFSADAEVREMYCRLGQLGDDKYNKYMSYVR